MVTICHQKCRKCFQIFSMKLLRRRSPSMTIDRPNCEARSDMVHCIRLECAG